ncbi:MAG: DUF3108 domain-containing protein [Bacteroidales bacterium]|nr:DUF3108 domain-containing protein [Bacteroidales bacterium]
MRIPISISFLLCTCMAICSLHAQEYGDSLRKASCIPVRELSQDNLAFQAGEQMSFVLHYKWGAVNSDVGNATVRLDTLTYNGEKAFQCSVYGKTTRWYDLFFKVREDFKSWFTCDGLRPLKFTRDTFEGNYQAKNTYIYDWSQDEPRIIADVYSSSSGQRYPEIPLTPCTFDLPSLFYFARNMDMDVVEQGKRYPMTFAIDDDVYNVYFIMHGRETIKVKGFGTVNTIRFAAKLLAGEVFTGEEDMTIWISDDENRVPVYFEAPLLVGKATGRMTGYEGLKYPFTSFQGKKRR